ncbi:GGDEF domain-containing protein [Aminipila butyrica]|uniref:GGDEF domain-containing protein n=1 Tax=Aminipila butyrica TaxID=433296 RepID=A0A858BVZ7_9FIRM|nr:GGDEF domain-containing protein [Aminipila butyrica]QIB69359.1 GGDEF domain-containing protein [Aminipila butyrica]
MFELKDMSESIKPYCSGESIFDFYRLIDPMSHEVFEYDKENHLNKKESLCYEAWGREKACPNCVSRHSYVKQRQYVKLEFLQGKVLLVISRPIKIEDKMLAMELIKDITASMIGFNYYRAENKNVEEMVSQFNELAVRDILTGSYNLDYIKNYIGIFLQKEIAFNTLTGIAIDIDDYTLVNSMYGYMVGNKVLQHIADILEQHAEAQGGIAGRLGPDEMGLFFINKTADEIEHICRQIQEDVTGTPLEVRDVKLTIHVTHGVASLEPEDEPDDFIGRLYFNLRVAQVGK